MKLRRALAALSVVAAAGVVPLVTSGTAQASGFDCVDYLQVHGYVIGDAVHEACGYEPLPTGPSPFCIALLVAHGVTGADADHACRLVKV